MSGGRDSAATQNARNTGRMCWHLNMLRREQKGGAHGIRPAMAADKNALEKPAQAVLLRIKWVLSALFSGSMLIRQVSYHDTAERRYSQRGVSPPAAYRDHEPYGKISPDKATYVSRWTGKPPAFPLEKQAACYSTVFRDSTISSFLSFWWAARFTSREKITVRTMA